MHMPTADPRRRHRYTVDEYHRMGSAGILRPDQRVELIEGEIIDMTPIGSRHAAAVKRLAKLLHDTVRERAIVSVQDPITLDRHSEPQPDIALLKPKADFYASAHPGPGDVLLVIEVADRSLAFDREVKLPLYARHGIPEAWLLDLEGKRLGVYRGPSAAGYRQASESEPAGPMPLPGLPGVTVDLDGFPPAG